MDVLEGSVSAAILLVSSTPTFAQAETNASCAVTDCVALSGFVGHGITIESRNADSFAIVHDALVGKTVAGYQARGTRETTSVVDTLPQSANSADVTPVIL